MIWAKRVIPINITKWILLSIPLLIMPYFLSASQSGHGAGEAATAFTAEYRHFLATYSHSPSDPVEKRADGYQFSLENGQLCIVGTNNTEIWRSNEEWYVDAFDIGDVNCDQLLDIVFVVWKSYRFGAEHPVRMSNEDAAVRCHLFVYSIKDNRVKSLWCSSSLPRPLYAFELNDGGKQTPTHSGVRLRTWEGAYTEDYRKTASTQYLYEWSSWGFIAADMP